MKGLNWYDAAILPPFALLLLAYAAASYLLFSIPDSSPLISAANVLFPLWNTGYSITIEEECAILIVLISSLTFLSHRKMGVARAATKTLQLLALSTIPLGLMMLVSPSGFDFLFVRVMNFQAKYDFIPWFTNEDLLVVSLALFVASTVLGRLLARR